MASRILLIETEKHARRMFAELLRQNGYEVLEAENGRGCVEQLFDQSVDLVVTNMIMPEMDGVETIVAVRERYPETKILAISANGINSADDCLRIAKALGAHKTLTKPLNPELFLREVNALIG